MIFFGSKRETIDECLNRSLFGLPAGHTGMVKAVRPGITPIFLFNYSTRQMHGVFFATTQPPPGDRSGSPGNPGATLVSDAWSTAKFARGRGGGTPFPAQVWVSRALHGVAPLPEEMIRALLSYGQGHKFDVSLAHAFWCGSIVCVAQAGAVGVKQHELLHCCCCVLRVVYCSTMPLLTRCFHVLRRNLLSRLVSLLETTLVLS